MGNVNRSEQSQPLNRWLNVRKCLVIIIGRHATLNQRQAKPVQVYFSIEKTNLLINLYTTLSTVLSDNTLFKAAIFLTCHMPWPRMSINKTLRSDWCCDYSCSDTNAIVIVTRFSSFVLRSTPDYKV